MRKTHRVRFTGEASSRQTATSVSGPHLTRSLPGPDSGMRSASVRWTRCKLFTTTSITTKNIGKVVLSPLLSHGTERGRRRRKGRRRRRRRRWRNRRRSRGRWRRRRLRRRRSRWRNRRRRRRRLRRRRGCLNDNTPSPMSGSDYPGCSSLPAVWEEVGERDRMTSHNKGTLGGSDGSGVRTRGLTCVQ